MDSYNIKKENRKKFQDKQKLNRRHRNHPRTPGTNNEDDTAEATEQQRIREYDETGAPILYSDEELDDAGNIVPKGTTNSFRYKEELEIQGLDKEEDEYLKTIDFNKIANSEDINLGHTFRKDVKKLTIEELSNLKIVDKDEKVKEDIAINSSNDDDAFHTVTSELNKKVKTRSPNTHEQPATQNKLPALIKDDEAFLDDLL